MRKMLNEDNIITSHHIIETLMIIQLIAMKIEGKTRLKLIINIIYLL